jgi:hypothetical protein
VDGTKEVGQWMNERTFGKDGIKQWMNPKNEFGDIGFRV